MGIDWEYILGSNRVQEAYEEHVNRADRDMDYWRTPVYPVEDWDEDIRNSARFYHDGEKIDDEFIFEKMIKEKTPDNQSCFVLKFYDIDNDITVEARVRDISCFSLTEQDVGHWVLVKGVIDSDEYYAQLIISSIQRLPDEEYEDESLPF